MLIDRPPMRQCLMDGDFFVGASLATVLTKLALHYVAQTPDKRKQNVCYKKLLRLFRSFCHLVCAQVSQ